MKPLVIILILMSACLELKADPKADSIVNKKIDVLVKRVESLQKSTDSIKKAIKPPEPATDNTKLSNGICFTCNSALDGWQRLIVFSPFIFSIIVGGYCAYRLRREDFRLSEALAESNPMFKKNVPNPNFNADNPGDEPPTIEQIDLPNKSTSRIIAFFSGMAAIVISLAATSYFFYMFLKTGKAPEIDKLFDILLGLGIGVIPYSFNKMADAIKKS
jgi:hypothetical protein